MQKLTPLRLQKRVIQAAKKALAASADFNSSYFYFSAYTGSSYKRLLNTAYQEDLLKQLRKERRQMQKENYKEYLMKMSRPRVSQYQVEQELKTAVAQILHKYGAPDAKITVNYEPIKSHSNYPGFPTTYVGY